MLSYERFATLRVVQLLTYDTVFLHSLSAKVNDLYAFSEFCYLFQFNECLMSQCCRMFARMWYFYALMKTYCLMYVSVLPYVPVSTGACV